jgi:nitrite reductase/ring-hydroxylating ferredoxin subunit
MALRVRVCRREEVPEGALAAFAVPGAAWPVLVTALGDEVIAVAGVCPHEDVALAGGRLEGGAVVCPGHGYRFDLRSGRCHHPALALRRYRVTVEAGEVWADLA